MEQLNFHNNSYKTPPRGVSRNDLLVLQKTIAAYKLWQNFLQHVPKLTRYTLGAKIDTLFLGLIEATYIATYASKTDKMGNISKISGRLDRLKLFIQLLWEIGALENKHYSAISIPLAEIGKIIGGWKKSLTK